MRYNAKPGRPSLKENIHQLSIHYKFSTTESIPPHQHDREAYNIHNGLSEKLKIIQELRKYAINTTNSSMIIQWNLIEASIDSQIEACTAIVDAIKSCSTNSFQLLHKFEEINQRTQTKRKTSKYKPLFTRLPEGCLHKYL